MALHIEGSAVLFYGIQLRLPRMTDHRNHPVLWNVHNIPSKHKSVGLVTERILSSHLLGIPSGTFSCRWVLLALCHFVPFEFPVGDNWHRKVIGELFGTLLAIIMTA